MQGPGGQEISYAAYIAPALLAVSAMNGAVYDSTWNVFFKMNFAKLYQGMLYTSLGPLDVAMGEIFLALLRGLLYATGFTAVMGVWGCITTPWALLMIPASVLIAFGFASFGMGITSFMKTFQQMDWINFVMLPMFLFSATFYPLSVYPQHIQWLIQAMPLWHGVELLRADQRGAVQPGDGRPHRLLPGDDRARASLLTTGRLRTVPEVAVRPVLPAGAFARGGSVAGRVRGFETMDRMRISGQPPSLRPTRPRADSPCSASADPA